MKDGYASNKDTIKQLKDKNGRIFDSKIFFDEPNKFLHSFVVRDSWIDLNIITPNSVEFDTQRTDVLILAVSFPQLIELLIRSKLIVSDANLTLSEYEHKFAFSAKKSLDHYSTNNVLVVQYSFFKVLDHYFGSNLAPILSFLKVPFYVNQLFFDIKKTINIKLNISKRNLSCKQETKLGESAHYCD